MICNRAPRDGINRSSLFGFVISLNCLECLRFLGTRMNTSSSALELSEGMPPPSIVGFPPTPPRLPEANE